MPKIPLSTRRGTGRSIEADETNRRNLCTRQLGDALTGDNTLETPARPHVRRIMELRPRGVVARGESDDVRYVQQIRPAVKPLVHPSLTHCQQCGHPIGKSKRR